MIYTSVGSLIKPIDVPIYFLNIYKYTMIHTHIYTHIYTHIIYVIYVQRLVNHIIAYLYINILYWVGIYHA